MKQQTLQTQYGLISEGKGHKDVFLKEAKRIYPDLISNSSNYEQAVSVLKTKNILKECIVELQPITAYEGVKKASWEEKFDSFLKEGKKEEPVKAEIKKPSKFVEKSLESNFDSEDETNLDNYSGNQVLNGIQFELSQNPDKTLDELKKIVGKNLAKDRLYYIKNAAFGVKGLGYTEDAPGLKPSKTDQMEKVKTLNENLNENDDDLFDEFVKTQWDRTNKQQWGNNFDGYKEKWNNIKNVSQSWAKYKDQHAGSLSEGLFSKNKKPKVDGTYTVEFIKGDGKGHAKVFQDPRVAEGYKDQVNSIAKDEIAIIYPTGKRPENLQEGKKPSMDDHLNKIQKAGEMVTMEAKINAIGEAIQKRQERIDMIGENEDLADLVNPAKMKELQKEISLLEKQKQKLEKLYEKFTGKKKQEVVDEIEEPTEEIE